MKIVAAILILLVFLGIGAGVYFFLSSQNKPRPTDITSFEDCKAAGNLVVETKPRECYTKENQVFVEIYNGALLEKTIVVTEPKPNQVVSTPFKVEGKAVGGWYFDNELTAKLVDETGNVVMTKQVKALNATKTNGFVPFVVAMNYKNSDVATNEGRLIIEKNNKTYKGDPGPLIIPVKFKQ